MPKEASCKIFGTRSNFKESHKNNLFEKLEGRKF
jgi:hypothetical protein